MPRQRSRALFATTVLAACLVPALAGCSQGQTSSSSTTASVAPVSSGTPSAAPANATTDASTPSGAGAPGATPTAAAPSSASAPTDPGTPAGQANQPGQPTGGTATPPATMTAAPVPGPSATRIRRTALPDQVSGWTKVEGRSEEGWTVAGYTSDRGTIEARVGQAASASAAAVAATQGRDVGEGCAEGARLKACAVTRQGRTTVVTSRILETEELLPLAGEFAAAVQ